MIAGSRFAAACAHDQPFERGEPHAGVDTPAPLHRGDAASVAQVTGDDLQAVQGLGSGSGQLHARRICGWCHGSRTGARGHSGRVRGGGRTDRPWGAWWHEMPCRRPPPAECRERPLHKPGCPPGWEDCEAAPVRSTLSITALTWLVDERGCTDLLPSMDDPVPDGDDLIQGLHHSHLGITQVGSDERNGLAGVLDGHFLRDLFRPVTLVMEERSGQPDPFHHPRSEDGKIFTASCR